MINWLLLALYFVAMPPLVYVLVRGQAGWTRTSLVIAVSATALALPFLVPSDLRVLRFVLAIIALVGVAKVVETAWARIHSPKMGSNVGRFCLWSCMAADTTWPDSEQTRHKARRDGVRRVVRGVAKCLIIFGLFAVSTAFPEMHGNLWLSTYWALWCSYLVFSAMFDFMCAPYMLAGIHVAEMFDAPPLARSPRDFWSRRWNLVFRTFCHRNVFVPMGGAKRAVLAVTVIFVISAVIHEYIVLTSLGYTRGNMSAFFLLHGAATIATTTLAAKLGKRELMPRAPAVAMHMAWLTLTAPLFLEPFLKVLPITEWRLW